VLAQCEELERLLPDDLELSLIDRLFLRVIHGL
jgi:hypothetical protein